MQVFRTIEGARQGVAEARASGKKIVFVPTMGALHRGHISLIESARQHGDFVVASIFVNPLQFGPTEDFTKYPRTLDADLDQLRNKSVDAVFVPNAEEMYPSKQEVFVDPGRLGERLCGKSRPGHFRGVATVVSKLFHILGPDTALFGQKDAAQHAVLRKMVEDLNLPVRIVIAPIVRDEDGLALSSRNAYLSPEERRAGLALPRSLKKVHETFLAGERDATRLEQRGREVIQAENGLKLDYFSLVDPDTLEALSKIERRALAAVAAFAGSTRLIDNVILEV